MTAVMPSWRETRATAWAAVGTRATRSSRLLDGRAHRGGSAHDVARPRPSRRAAATAGSVGDAVAPTRGTLAHRPRHEGTRSPAPRSALGTASASDAQPRAADTAASCPPVTWSRVATVPTMVVVIGRGQQRGGAVLAAQARTERPDAGGRGGPVALGLALPGDELLDLRLGRGEADRSPLVGVEALLALLLDGDPALEARKLLLGLGGPGAGGGHALLQPADLGLARLDPATAGADRRRAGVPSRRSAAARARRASRSCSAA